MNWKMNRWLAVLLFGCFSLALGAQTAREDSIRALPRPVEGFYRLEIGGRQALSTYLSPFYYSGTSYAVSGFWTKALPRNPEHLAMGFEGRISFSDLLNPAHTAREIDFHANVQWGLDWQKRFSGGWLVSAGGAVGVYGGMLYLPRNGNNPVDAQFAAGISARGFASKVLRIGRLPILVSDRLSIPLFSGFFRQDYGESYYEIYLGNHAGLAHFGWPGNRFGIDNLLSVTLDFGRTAMEVGYRFSMQNERANNLTTRMFNNAFVIGVIPGGLGLKQNRKAITPLY